MSESTPKLPEKSAKSEQGTRFSGNGLVGAIAATTDVNARLVTLSSEDVAYVDKVLGMTELMDVFGYSMSVPEASRNE